MRASAFQFILNLFMISAQEILTVVVNEAARVADDATSTTEDLVIWLVILDFVEAAVCSQQVRSNETSKSESLFGSAMKQRCRWGCL